MFPFCLDFQGFPHRLFSLLFTTPKLSGVPGVTYDATAYGVVFAVHSFLTCCSSVSHSCQVSAETSAVCLYWHHLVFRIHVHPFEIVLHSHLQVNACDHETSSMHSSAYLCAYTNVHYRCLILLLFIEVYSRQHWPLSSSSHFEYLYLCIRTHLSYTLLQCTQ